MLLSLRYISHTPGSMEPAIMIWDFEVREGLRARLEPYGTQSFASSEVEKRGHERVSTSLDTNEKVGPA